MAGSAAPSIRSLQLVDSSTPSSGPNWLPAAIGAKVAFDVAASLKLVGGEAWDSQALCACCQTATLASVASLLPALLEAGRRQRRLLPCGWSASCQPTSEAVG